MKKAECTKVLVPKKCPPVINGKTSLLALDKKKELSVLDVKLILLDGKVPAGAERAEHVPTTDKQCFYLLYGAGNKLLIGETISTKLAP